MKAREYLTGGTVSGPLCDVFDIDERAFDLYFRNWIISNRSSIARMAHEIVSEKNLKENFSSGERTADLCQKG